MDLLDDIVPAAPPVVEFTMRVAGDDVVALRDLAHDLDLDPVDTLLFLLREVRRTGADSDRMEMRRTSSVEYRNNGADFTKAFKHVCSGCGREFDSNRRQLPGKRSWCGRPECKKEAAALRARDYRDRKAKEGS